MICTLDELKYQLNYEIEMTQEDQYLTMLLIASEEAVLNYLNRKRKDFQREIPEAIKIGILMFAATLYTNRETITYGNANEIPNLYHALLSPYRNPVIV